MVHIYIPTIKSHRHRTTRVSVHVVYQCRSCVFALIRPHRITLSSSFSSRPYFMLMLMFSCLSFNPQPSGLHSPLIFLFGLKEAKRHKTKIGFEQYSPLPHPIPRITAAGGPTHAPGPGFRPILFQDPTCPSRASSIRDLSLQTNKEDEAR